MVGVRPKLVEQRIAADIPYLAVVALGKPVGNRFVVAVVVAAVAEHSTVDTERAREFDSRKSVLTCCWYACCCC